MYATGDWYSEPQYMAFHPQCYALAIIVVESNERFPKTIESNPSSIAEYMKILWIRHDDQDDQNLDGGKDPYPTDRPRASLCSPVDYYGIFAGDIEFWERDALNHSVSASFHPICYI